MPAGPEPMTATFSGRFVMTLSSKTLMGFRDSGPYRSVTKRFKARIEIGWSSWPRLHAGSQGCPQTRPQMDANGLGVRA
jgi:hypothetical protein